MKFVIKHLVSAEPYILVSPEAVAFCRTALVMEGGGAGGMGRGPFRTTSTARGTAATGSSSEMGAAMEKSCAVWVTVTAELCLAMRGSLRVMLTEEMVGVVLRGV